MPTKTEAVSQITQGSPAEHASKESYLSPEWGIVWATLVLAAITAALAVYTAKLYRATVSLGEEARKTSREQFEEMSRMRVLQHRPRLHVRNMVASDYSPSRPTQGQYYVSNTGGTLATVTESHCVVYRSVNGLPQNRPYEGQDGNNPIAPGTVIEAGSSVPALFLSGGTFGDTSLPVMGVTYRFFVMGWLEYVDLNDTKRRTAFCQELISGPGGKRYVAVEDPDYQFEE